MIDINFTNGITGTGLNQDNALGGLDLMTTVQLLMVKDFDNQLRHLGREMKMMNQAKQKYRETIEQNQNLLLRESHDDKNPKVNLTSQEYNEIFLQNDEIIIHPTEMELEIIPKTYEPTDSDGTPLEMGHLKWENNRPVYEVEKNKIETKISTMNLKLDSLNEQSEQLSLKLQSLTNKRKTAFETVSNIIHKEAETMGTFVRNLLG